MAETDNNAGVLRYNMASNFLASISWEGAKHHAGVLRYNMDSNFLASISWQRPIIMLES